MTDNKNKERHLFYLNELSDYKVASDDPDVRGWDVRDADDRVVGKVENLLVNKVTEKVVYLDVEVDKSIIEKNHKPYGNPVSSDVHEFINKEGENHLIIPIGHARLNEDKKFVYTDKINHQTFAETKRKQRGADVDREYEVVVLESYNRNTQNARTDVPGDTTARDLDTGREERERNSELNDRSTARTTTDGRSSEDDNFYEREDFDRTNFRHRR
ncbi:PRC-barrel domain-containing protein [Salinimicrobium sp. GXAS 041]|uniref:PRC-barrel domain-containing protein n=1 Tax=Salinimicrobium sp. GXAS 041 TaxID=3400806 RepID=UPI003C734CE6